MSQRIADAMADGAPVTIEWSCPDEVPACVHEVDLLDRGFLATYPLEQRLTAYQMVLLPAFVQEVDLSEDGLLSSVRIEHPLQTWNIRPDITLLAEDTPKVMIEVVDTHPPEQPVIDAGPPVLEVHVSEAADLNVLADDAIPVAVMHNYPCPHPPDPICDVCGRRQSAGCLNCEVCRQHVTSEHHYCDTCEACLDREHPYRCCFECGAIVGHCETGAYRARWLKDAWRDRRWYCRPCASRLPPL